MPLKQPPPAVRQPIFPSILMAQLSSESFRTAQLRGESWKEFAMDSDWTAKTRRGIGLRRCVPACVRHQAYCSESPVDTFTQRVHW